MAKQLAINDDTREVKMSPILNQPQNLSEPKQFPIGKGTISLGLTLLMSLSIFGCGINYFGAKVGQRSYSSSLDSDRDGIPDLHEKRYGLDPNNADANGNGIPDGQEDPDGDGLSTQDEIRFGFDPFWPYSHSKRYPVDGADQIKDGDKDLDGDGIPLAWELKYGLDPISPADAEADSDGDGFTNKEEFPGLDPKAKGTFPGAPHYVKTLDKDSKVGNRTNTGVFTAIIESCLNATEEIFISLSPDRGLVLEATFVPCSQFKNGYDWTLDFTESKSYEIYIWRKVDGKVRYSPVTQTFIYDGTPPDEGPVKTSSTKGNSIVLDFTQPVDIDYTTMLVYRFVGSECKTASIDLGELISAITKDTTQYTDTGLQAGLTYCYQIQWKDDLGNIRYGEVSQAPTYPTFTVSDGSAEATGRSKDGSVRVKPESCEGVDSILVTGSADIPSDLSGAVACTAGSLTTSFATILGAISDDTEETKKIYVWSVVNGRVSVIPHTMDIIYDKKAPAQNGESLVSAASASSGAGITFTISKPSDEDLASLSVYRYEGATCSGSATSAGTLLADITIATTSYTDSINLKLGVSYCYQFIWVDVVGNLRVFTHTAKTAYPTITASDNDANVEGRTNRTTVRLGIESCAGVDSFLVTLNNTKPTSKTGAVSCATGTASMTFSSILPDIADGTEESRDLYVWAVSDTSIAEESVKVTIVQDKKPVESGSIALSSSTGGTMTLTITNPTEADFDTLAVRRISGNSCVNSLITDGTGITITKGATSAEDSGLTAGINYCYKVFWYDLVGNIMTQAFTKRTSLPAFTIYDDTTDATARTNSTSIRVTMTECSGSSHILVSTSNTAPAVGDAAWKTCSTTDKALTFTPLSAQSGEAENLVTLYMWSKKDSTVSEISTSTQITYDTKPPSDGFSVSSPFASSTQSSVVLTIAQPQDSDYATFEVYRHTPYNSCTFSGLSKMTADSNNKSFRFFSGLTDNYTISGLSDGATHCFRITVTDSVGNSKSLDITDAITQNIPSTCTLTKPSSNPTTNTNWYKGTTVAYTITCNGTVASFGNTGKPTFLDQVTTLPANSIIIYGTATEPNGTNHPAWTAKLTDIKGTVIDVAMPEIDIIDTYSNINPTETMTSAVTLTSNVASALTGTTPLDANYGAHYTPTLVVFTGDATTDTANSNGSVASTETNIPGLTFTNNSSCSGVASPYLCLQSSSYSRPNVTADLNLLWDFGKFDFGEYFVRTKIKTSYGGSPVADAQTDLTAAFTPTTVSVANGGFELIMDDEIGFNDSGFYSSTAWVLYQPSVAFHDTISTASLHRLVALFPFSGSKDEHAAGYMTIDRATNAKTMTKVWFDPTDADTILTGNMNSEYMSVVSSSSSSVGWFGLGLRKGESPSNNRMYMSILPASPDNPPTSPPTTIDLFTHTTYEVRSPAISKVYDDESTKRHAIAYVVDDGTNQDLYLTLVNSEPPTNDKAGFLNGLATYHDDSNANNHIEAELAAVQIHDVGTSFDPTEIKIDTFASGTEDYAYIAWESTANQISAAKVRINSGASATTIKTTTGDYVDLEGATSNALGNKTFDIAAGKNDDGTQNLLGMVVTNFTTANICYFAVFQEDTSVLDRKYTYQLSATTTACYFPTIDFNPKTNKFLVTYYDNSTRDTYFISFSYNTGSGINRTTAELDTDRIVLLDRTSPERACLSTTDYSQTWNRLTVMSVDQSSGLSCTGSAKDYKFNMYFPSEVN